MSYCGVSIFSDNLSGQTANVTFFPCTGGTISLGDQVFPFTYVTDYWYGTYNCYVSTYAYDYVVEVPCPSSTPTPTPTLTPTPTITASPTIGLPTSTPTSSETQTPTPSITSSQTPTPTITSSETPTPTPSITSSETPTPTITSSETPTPTPTLTQTPTPFFYSFALGSGDTQNGACSATSTLLYTTRSGLSPIEQGEILYTNAILTETAPNGYYSDGTNWYEVDSVINGIPGQVTTVDLGGCSSLVTPTPTITQTSTSTPTPTVTETPTNTPTVTETPTNTPTVTVTPSITASQTVTPTLTHRRYSFSSFFGLNAGDACSELLGRSIYGDSPNFGDNLKFYNNSTGPVTINMTGFYSFEETVLQLNNLGNLVGVPFGCF